MLLDELEQHTATEQVENFHHPDADKEWLEHLNIVLGQAGSKVELLLNEHEFREAFRQRAEFQSTIASVCTILHQGKTECSSDSTVRLFHHTYLSD